MEEQDKEMVKIDSDGSKEVLDQTKPISNNKDVTITNTDADASKDTLKEDNMSRVMARKVHKLTTTKEEIYGGPLS